MEYDKQIRNRFNNSHDGFEIVSDIENRIAELLDEKLKLANRKVVIKQDVDEIIDRLGKVSDFDSDFDSKQNEQSQENTNRAAESNTKHKKLFREPINGILGGVCSGIARYLNIDPTFVRIVWILLSIAYGAGAIAYLILWIILPESRTSDERDKGKSQRRLFRDPDNKSIGGVCAGLAIFLGINAVWIRLIFVALWLCPSLFFGAHYIFKPVFFFLGFPMLVLYIVLMIIIPEAKTLTDKMAMKGEPDNLDGIINKIREMGTKSEETIRNTEAKGFFVTIFDGLGKVLSFIILFLIKACGLALSIAAILMIIALPIAGAIYLTDNAVIRYDEGLFEVYNFIDSKYRTLFVVALLVVLIIPAFRLAWFGLKTMVSLKPIGKTVSLSLWGVWIMALICASYMMIETALDFRETVGMEESRPVQLSVNNTIYLSASSMDELYDTEIVIDDQSVKRKFYLSTRNRQNRVQLSIEKSPDGKAHLFKRMSACGRNPKAAIKNIENISYTIDGGDSTLYIDRMFRLKDNVLWRNQRVSLILQLPLGCLVKANQAVCGMSYQLNYWNCREYEDSNYAIWQMTENGLKCMAQKQ
jgi:phage shock protein PspC (stress-responsive transcriptional regulator)